MALSAGYDINDPSNGIPLPTVKNQYRLNKNDGSYPVENRQDATSAKNFGKLDDDEKITIRNHWMETLGAQWHVGNHHYEVNGENEEDPEGMSDEGAIDHAPYDIEVVKALIKEGRKLIKFNLCKTDEDHSETIKNIMNAISKDIKTKLNRFKNNPKDSYPFYVSIAALNFANK